MVTGPAGVVGDLVVHGECGDQVLFAGELLLDPDGVEHRCRDYVVWHGPVDRRDPDLLDVPGGWRPRVVVARAA